MSNISLNKKIGITVAIGLVLGLGIFSWLGLHAVRTTTARILDERLNRARIVADLLDENLKHLLFHVQNAVKSITDVNSEDEFDSAANSLLGILADPDIPILNIISVDKMGKILYAKLDDASSPVDFSQDAEFRIMAEASRPEVSNAVYISGKQVVLVTSPIYNKQGEATGTFAVVVDIGDSTIRAFGQAGRIGETGYTEVVDGNGTVLIRTQPSSVLARGEKSDHPQKFAQLINEGKAAVRTCHVCHEDNAANITRKQDIIAFAPLSAATWGVALRQSEEEALAPTTQLEQRLLLIGAVVLVGIILIIWSIMQSVVKPLTALTTAAQRVASGDFKATVPGRRRDEIGRLNTAFHIMTDKLEASRGELLSKNRALSVLNSIATTVSQSLNLDLVLENALRRVLEISQANYGCVFLVNPPHNQFNMKVSIGQGDLFSCQQPVSPDKCACCQVLRSGKTLAVNDSAQCPLLKGSPDDARCFISVPLKSREKTLGVMNIYFTDGSNFTENEFKLLESIGLCIGLAIENSTLYEEAKRKEQLRGQLLSQLIGAQEEERKRISRELHDEHGQILTGLIMNLEKMEAMVYPEQVQLKARLEKSRMLVSRSLDNIRLLTVGLRPSDLDDIGLVAAISSYAEDRLGTAGIALKFEADNLEGCMTPTMETAFFRIIQEAVNNIIRHAKAKNVTITLKILPGKVVATVQDDGHGFESSLKDKLRDSSLGLLGMRERTELLGGTFSITSHPGRGTKLVIDIPVPESISVGEGQPDGKG